MSLNINRLILCSLLISILAFGATSCQKEKPDGIEHVIIIGIDGMSVQGFLEGEKPCLDSLLHSGAYTYKTRGIIPTISAPNWNTMLCGAGPEATGILDNGWARNIDDCPPVATSKNHVFPNIFSVIREQMPDAEIGAIYNWGDFGTLLETEVMNKFEHYGTEEETAKKAAEYIQDKKPTCLFIHFDNVDHAGHHEGHMSPAYIKSISEVDKDVRTVVNAVKAAGISDKTMIMVVSDHGGIYYAHGGNAYEEFTTTTIYSGKGVKKNYNIQQQVYRYDVAADVIFALGLKSPQVWVGRPVKAAFEGFNEPDNLYKGIEILPPPSFTGRRISTLYGDLAVDTGVNLVLRQPIGVEGKIHYTTDGTMPVKESPVYTGPVMLEHSAIVKAKIFGEESESPTVWGQYRVARNKDGNGLNYSFYHLPGEKSLPSLQSKTPVAKGVCYEVAFGDSVAFPGLNKLKEQYKTDYGISCDGWLQIDKDAEYTFRIWGRGGYRLIIDSKTIIEHTDLNSKMNNPGSIKLKKGIYPFRVEYFTSGDRGYLDLYYEADGLSRQFVPANKLFKSKMQEGGK